MKITVTKEDIANGVPKHCDRCPIALALNRQTERSWLVELEYVVPGNDTHYLLDDAIELPRNARNFIKNFDAGKNVRAFSFELDLPESTTV